MADQGLVVAPDALAGRVAIVTGGGTGIGADAGRLLAGAGADVVLAARKTERLEGVRDELVAMEWGTRGIRANCIAVGAVASEGALRSWERAGILDDLVASAGEPPDIARAILYLATDASRFMNGQTIALMGNHFG